MPKERPILFSGEMVRAILEGRKTQTRRVVKPQPEQRDDGWHVATKPRSGYSSESTMCSLLPMYCPYGKPGDRLWVRETWQKEVVGGVEYVWYRADCDQDQLDAYTGVWRPSIFMPRAASRITLEIVRICVERLQDISTADIEVEGTPCNPMQQASHRNDSFQRWRDFMWLWDSINGLDAHRRNPWVWAITFVVLDQRTGGTS